MQKIFILIAFMAASAMLLQGARAELGVDTTHYPEYVSSSSWSCLSNQGYDFALLNVYHRNQTNQFFQHNFNQAKPYFDHIDVMATLCSNKKPRAVQTRQIKRDLGKHFRKRIFLEVSPLDGCWGDDQTYNLRYLQTIARALHKYGFRLGIFSNASNWETIMGNTGSTALSELPLWYASNNGQADFEDNTQAIFAGWSVPEVKQYRQNVETCGTTVNLDFADGAPTHKPDGPGHHVKKGHKQHGHGHRISEDPSNDETEISISKGSKEDQSEKEKTISVASASTEYNSFSTECEGSDCYYETTYGDTPDDDDYSYPDDFDGPTVDGAYEENGQVEGENGVPDGDADAAENGDVDEFAEEAAEAADEVLDVIEDILLAILSIF